MNFTVITAWVIARMQEPTTWRGLIGLAAAAGVVINPHQAAVILAAGMGLAGFIGVVSKDPKNLVADVTAAVNDIIIPVVQANANTAVAAAVAAAVPTTQKKPAA